MSTEGLKPCPFCGFPAISTYTRDGRVMVCEKCHARGAPAYHGRADQPSAEDRARANWNARAKAPATQAGDVEAEYARLIDELLTHMQRRSHGYVIASVLPVDKIVEQLLTLKDRRPVPPAGDVGALKPFADIADTYDGTSAKDDHVIMSFGRQGREHIFLTVGQCRRAREALLAVPPAEPQGLPSLTREGVIKAIRDHVRVSTSNYGLSSELEDVEDAADAILALAGEGGGADLRSAAQDLLSAALEDFGQPDDGDEDGEPVGHSTEGGTAITFGHIRRLQAALAAAPQPVVPATLTAESAE